MDTAIATPERQWICDPCLRLGLHENCRGRDRLSDDGPCDCDTCRERMEEAAPELFAYAKTKAAGGCEFVNASLGDTVACVEERDFPKHEWCDSCRAEALVRIVEGR